MAELFSSRFIQSLQALSIKARWVTASPRHAEQRSKEQGWGQEFQDFRSYMPGDDTRRIDWNVYRRSGELFIRLFDENRDLPMYVLLDQSDSMYFEQPTRADMARQMTAVVASISLRQMDNIAIYPFGSEIGNPLALMSGWNRLPEVLAYLQALNALGKTDLCQCLDYFTRLNLRSGLAVLISDFFDPCGVDKIIDRLSRIRHKLLIVQLVRTSDANPELDGDLQLVDCETNQDIQLSITSTLLSNYQKAYTNFCQSLHDFAFTCGGGYFRLDAEEPILKQLDQLFINRTLTL